MSRSRYECSGMILDALGCSWSIFKNIDFHDFDPHDVINVTWRRVLRTPVPLLEGVPQVKSCFGRTSLLYEVPGGDLVEGLPPAASFLIRCQYNFHERLLRLRYR